jgi:endonuclease III
MLALDSILDRLASVYGEPTAPPARTMLELLLLENVAYLVDDHERLAAFDVLRSRVGLTPEQILAVPVEDLTTVTGHGILPTNQAAKLHRIAHLALDEFDGDVEMIRTLPLKRATRAMMRFPSIGEPGAEKILLFARAFPVLGLESNGVRVLTRLGLVPEEKSYAATYRQVQHFARPYADRGFEWLLRAHQLLRQHGQHLCKRSRPLCVRCPLTDTCAFVQANRPQSNTMRVAPPCP